MAHRNSTRDQKWDRFLWLLLFVVGGGLLATWPLSRGAGAGGDNATTGCLRNLQLIGLAYSQYARDYDGKFPLGVDPEDRMNPHIWDAMPMFRTTVGKTPYLHEVLRPYVPGAETFRCPADDGWTVSRLPPGISRDLVDVKPSSYALFGTSYYCLTVFNFSRSTVADLQDPGGALVLFDGELWHGNPRRTLNGLFADGHAANLTAEQFQTAINNAGN